MLTPEVAREIRRLLQGRWNDRQIADMTGAGRSTICRMRHGYIASPPKRAEQEPAAPVGPPRRCPGCGGLVAMPCRLCALRAGLPPGQQPIADDEAPLELELHPAHRIRYEAIYTRRRSVGITAEGRVHPPTESPGARPAVDRRQF